MLSDITSNTSTQDNANTEKPKSRSTDDGVRVDMPTASIGSATVSAPDGDQTEPIYASSDWYVKELAACIDAALRA